MNPSPVKSPAKPLVGESPPVGKLWVTGLVDAEAGDQGAVVRPGVERGQALAQPVEIAQEQRGRRLADGDRRDRVRLIVEEPAADAGEDLDVIGPAVGHGQVGLSAARAGRRRPPRPARRRSGPAAPAIIVQLDPLPWPSKTETSLEPVSATSRSGWPLRSATASPVGSVPTGKPAVPLIGGPNWPLPSPG